MKKHIFLFLCVAVTFFFMLPSSVGALNYKQLNLITDFRSEAIVAYRDSDYQKAANAYNKAIAAGDSSMVPYYNLACCYGRLGKTDSCLSALRVAVDRGYIDHLRMGFDKDLNILHSMPEWSALWMQVYQNSFGKIQPKDFERRMKDGIAKSNGKKLLRLSENAGPIDSVKMQTIIDLSRPYLEYSHLQNADSLYQIVELAKKDTRYENHHFVFYSTLAFPLPVTAPFLDADVAVLMAKDTLYASYRSIDHAYMWFDDLSFKTSYRSLDELRKDFVLTDSVIALALQVKPEELFENQNVFANDNPLVEIVKQMVNGDPLTFEMLPSEVGKKSFSKDDDIYFIRLANIPVKKAFSGVKIAFRANTDVALLVVGSHYCYIKNPNISQVLQKALYMLTSNVD